MSAVVRGRRSLAAVASVDASLLVVAAALILSELDSPNLALALFAAHLTHVVTVALTYSVVRYAPEQPDLLRMLCVFYLVALVLDVLALAGRVVLVLHADATPFAAATRLLLSVAFVLTDLCGVVLANVSFEYMSSRAYNDEQLLELAARTIRANNVATASAAKLPALAQV